jgi:hypothetical protein
MNMDHSLGRIKAGIHARCNRIIAQGLCLTFLLFLWMSLSSGISTGTETDPAGSAGVGSPADRLPPHIRRITWFGERADWSHDGKKILFLGKTYGDAYEVEVQTGIICPVTHHFYHGGFTRALYLASGDILLSGAMTFDAARPHLNRSKKAELWVLDRSLAKPPVPLGTKCSEGPAASRARMHIAWAQVAEQYPDEMPVDTSRILEADIVYENGVPRPANQRLVLDSRSLSFKCTLET